LDAIHKETPVSVLINGGGKGADKLALNWAVKNNIPFIIFKADWKKA